MQQPIFGVTGWKNSGKTTLVVRLVEEFRRRGMTVSAIKHAHHSFEIDHKGRDSFRFREAGAAQIAVVSPVRWALLHELRDGEEPPFEEILSHLDPQDIILVEGYKGGPFPKIEARSSRSRTREPLAPDDPQIVAVAGETPEHGAKDDLPWFQIDDVAAIADFILAYQEANDRSRDSRK